MLTRPDICSHCGQPIPPTGLRLPPIKQRIYEVVQRHPDISAALLNLANLQELLGNRAAAERSRHEAMELQHQIMEA